MDIPKDFHEDYQKVYYDTPISFLNPFKTVSITEKKEIIREEKKLKINEKNILSEKSKKDKESKINEEEINKEKIKEEENLKKNKEKFFSEKEISKKSILVHYYKFEYIEDEIILLLSPIYLGEKIPIIKNLERNEYDFIPTFLDIKYIGKEFIQEIEFKKIIKIHKKFFKMVFEEIYEYKKIPFINLLGKFENNILDKNNLEKINKDCQDVFFKNYLIFPITKNFQKLNLDLGLEISDFEIKKIQLQKHFDELKNKENYFEDENLKNYIIKKKYDENNFSSSYTIFLCHLGKLKNLTLLDYLKIISNFCYKYNNENSSKKDFINNIKNYYNNSFINLLDKKISDLLQKNFYGIEDCKEMSIFSCFFDIIEKYENKKNFEEEIFFLSLEIQNVKNLDYTIPSIFEKSLNEINSYEMITEKKINPKYLKINFSKENKFSGFHCKKINGWYKNLSLLKNFEISILHRELRLKLNLNYIYFENMSVALTPFSMNSILNYEVFETIGDSILKFIITIYLFLKKTKNKKNEGELSQMRSNLVSNKFLLGKAIKKNIHFYIKTQNRLINDFIPPYFHLNWDFINKDENKVFYKKYIKEHVLGNKSIADVIEALIGAAYFSNNRLCESFYFMKQIEILKDFDLTKFEKVFYEDFEIDEEVLKFLEDDDFLDKIYRDITFVELFYVVKKKNKSIKNENEDFYLVDKIKKIGNKEKREIFLKKALDKFQKEDLNYEFKEITFLTESLKVGTKNFERLEFLGDAVLDIYAIINLYKIAKILKLSLNPEILHCFKVFFLSSDPLSNLTLNFNLLKHLEIPQVEKKEKINTYLKSYTENPIKMMWYTNKILAPKILSDAFEALIGAIFLDSGFKGVKIILDKVIISFMYFYLIHYKYILLDLKSYVINNFSKKGFKASFERDDDKIFLKVGEKIVIEKVYEEESHFKSVEISIAVEYLNNKDKYDKIILGMDFNK